MEAIEGEEGTSMKEKKKIGFIIKEKGKNSWLSFETSFVHLILKVS